ncbi:MAG: hypothetical protein VX191_03665, partial [Candidatus Thermoplasmatota archaeon]|nr:hypothetical protein [Candidatus Thermoplasmatota archaeon]
MSAQGIKSVHEYFVYTNKQYYVLIYWFFTQITRFSGFWLRPKRSIVRDSKTIVCGWLERRMDSGLAV